MKKNKWSSEEAMKIIAAMEAEQFKAQKEDMGVRLKELAYELEQLKENHPEEYWEAAVTMDLLPTVIPRRAQEQKEWRDTHEKKGIWIKGKGKKKGGRYFDPKLPLNKDVIEAWDGVKQLQYQCKKSPQPMHEDLKNIPPLGDVLTPQDAEELRNLPPLSEATVPQWVPWIVKMIYILNDQKPEDNAHAAKNIRNRKERNKTKPTSADVRNDLLRDLRTPQKGALTMLALDLDRVRGVQY